jgi:hypothetical protein
MRRDNTTGKNIFFTGSRDELDKIEAVFQWLKIYLGLNKTELYKEALLWIASNEKVMTEFIKYLEDKKLTKIGNTLYIEKGKLKEAIHVKLGYLE